MGISQKCRHNFKLIDSHKNDPLSRSTTPEYRLIHVTRHSISKIFLSVT